MKQVAFVQRYLLTEHEAMDMFKCPSSDAKESFMRKKLHLTLKPLNALLKDEVGLSPPQEIQEFSMG